MSVLDPLETLYDLQPGAHLPLPPALASLYGQLQFPTHPDRPHVIANFVTSLDGVVALNDSDQSGGGEISGIPDLLYDPDYLGGGTHENLAGQDLDPHVDFNLHPRFGWYRRLNLLVYLNPEWDENWGGCLELHRDPHLPPAQDPVKRVLPLMNRAVLFETSERSWHGFEAVALKVESIAVRES